jgi:uncharacterized BrkB/YihY/UPF0761 family membrane protein
VHAGIFRNTKPFPGLSIYLLEGKRIGKIPYYRKHNCQDCVIGVAVGGCLWIFLTYLIWLIPAEPETRDVALQTWITIAIWMFLMGVTKLVGYGSTMGMATSKSQIRD